MKMEIVAILSLALTTASAFSLSGNQVQPEGRISNGHNAAIGRFPYQVGLFTKRSDSQIWCGGSLIGDRWVLTAAHCADGAVEVIVFLGATDRLVPDVVVKAEKIISHPGWDTETDANDICLMKIPVINFTSNIQAVKLPEIGSSDATYAGDHAIASGWGRIASSKPGIVDTLQWARMEVITNDVCTEYYPDKIDTLKMCTNTTGGVSTCQGDSGGPLVSESTGKLIGVVSLIAGEGCDKGSPAIFTRVSSFLPWIKKHTDIGH